MPSDTQTGGETSMSAVIDSACYVAVADLHVTTLRVSKVLLKHISTHLHIST